MDYEAHHLLHHQSKPPKKPSSEVMARMVEEYGKTGGDREFNQGADRDSPDADTRRTRYRRNRSR